MDLKFHVDDNNIAFTYANNVKGTLNQNDVRVLLENFARLPFGSKYLEIGSYLGCSSIIAGLSLKGKSFVYSHDIWEDDMKKLSTDGGPPPDVENYFYKFYENVRANNLEGIVIPIIGDSSYTVGIHENKSIDLAFVDGYHSYEGCLKDLNSILSKMKTNSIILCHDAVSESGVEKAIRDFCNTNNFKHVNGYMGSSIVSIRVK